MERKALIAILAGGYSGEFEVSVKSAQTILDAIDRELFEPYVVEVSKNEWSVMTADGALPVDLNSFSFKQADSEERFEYAYVIIHGTPGENGLVQGYLDMLDIPYNTGDVLNMALTFNKAQTQKMMMQEGVKVAQHLIFKKENRPSEEEIVEKLGLPCVVKPTESGSSIGVSMVKEKSQLEEALDLAFSIYHEVIIEEMLVGRELACGVYLENGRTVALPITEISSAREFFDYKAKYEDEATQEITPAPIPSDAYEECQRISRSIYELTDCRGIARADFFLCDDGLYFVEINTNPGMSKESIVPKQIENAEIDLKSLLTSMISSKL